MRVSDTQRVGLFMGQIQERLANLTRIEQELGTGRSLNVPSENVRNADQALRADEALAADAQYLRNIADGKGWVESADSKLQAITDLISEIDSLALAANNSSQNEVDRRNTAIQIDQKLEALIELVNATHGDRYLFGGYQTTAAPFTVTRNAQGQIESVSANPDTVAGRIYRQISQNDQVQINVSGSQLFQPVGAENTDQDVFYVIAALRDTIGNNNTPPEGFEDTRSNEYLRGQLSTIRERITDQQTYLGSIGQRLDQTTARIKERELQLTDALEQAQGVDMTDLVSRLSVEQGAYNALASMASRVLQQSLVDYLG
jgi:flagellar hook-associated protein 3 FlgL